MAKIGEYKNFNGLDKNYYMWFAIYITIGLVLSFTIPFPTSLLAYVTMVMILQTHRLKKMQDNYRASKPPNSIKNTIIKNLEDSENLFQILYLVTHTIRLFLNR